MTSDIYTTGAAKVGSAADAGTSAINSFDPSAWGTETQGGLSNLWNNQNTVQNAYFNAYKNAIASNPSVSSLYTEGNKMFNVPNLQKTANTLSNAVLKAPISNVQAAKGFNVDQNQIDQKTAQDLYYLTPQANAAQTNVNTAESNAANFVNAGVAQNNFNLLPIQQQGQYLMDAYARQQSGFTTVAQSKLQALQAKMDAGVQLSTSEMSAYASLSSAEASYQSTLASSAATVKAAQIGNNFQILKGGEGLYSANTGKITPFVGAT